MPIQPRMLLVLSENWTLTGGRADLPAAVRWAREAEDAGFDSVMVSEHIVLGPDASAAGVMGNPRDYALRATRTRTPPGRTPCCCSPPSPPSPPGSAWRPPPSSRRCATPCCSPASSAPLT
ncbi:hypothetical protein SUDANB51_07635 [Streptomyces sp. enrichment culture]